MKLLNKFYLTGIVLTLFAVSGVFGITQKFNNAAAPAVRPEIKLNLAGTVSRDGKTIAVADAGRVNSDEIIDWTITSVNVGTASAVSHEAVAQIPAGTSFVAGSAQSEVAAAISFSIDNGQTFSAKPTISVKQADGSVKEVTAPVSMYTQIRYQWDSPLSASNERKATYKVAVK